MEVVINALGLNADIDDGSIEKAWLTKLEPKTTQTGDTAVTLPAIGKLPPPILGN